MQISLIFPASRVTSDMLFTINNLVLSGSDEFEIIVVIDGAGKANDGMLQSFYFLGDRLRVIATGEKRGPAYCRNLGAKNARNEVLVFCDFDVIVPISTFEGLSEVRSGEALLPAVHPIRPNTKPSRFFSDLSLAPKNFDGKILGASACFAVLRKDFDSCEGFDENYKYAAGEDFDFFSRFQNLGNQVVFVRDHRVFHLNPRTVFGLISRAFRYGRRGHLVDRQNVSKPQEPNYAYRGTVRKFAVVFLGATRYLLAIPSSEAQSRSKIAEKLRNLEGRLIEGMEKIRISPDEKKDSLSRLVISITKAGPRSPWSHTLPLDEKAPQRYETYRSLIFIWRISFMSGVATNSLMRSFSKG